LLVVLNVALLTAIWLSIPEGGTFTSVFTKVGVDICPLVIAALAMTGIILTGAIDLSVASIIAVSATVFGVLVAREQHPFVCFSACFATAWTLSMVNGWLIRGLRLPAIIVTLGALTFYRGVAAIVASLLSPADRPFRGTLYVDAREGVTWSYDGPGEMYAGWILIAVVALAFIWEWNARTPRTWLALGNSEEACRLQGLHPGRVLQSAFFVGGIFIGIASVVAASSVQAIVPEKMVSGLELQIIGAVVVGGTNIFGGEGSYLGTILGCFFFYFVSQLLLYLHIPEHYAEVVIGATVIAVIGVDCLLHRRAKLIEELR
jgi:ribose/xylose/arabinose/galactoside ABC-type transport system permease subunit